MPEFKYPDIRKGKLENLSQKYFPGTIESIDKAQKEFEAYWKEKFVNLRRDQGMTPFKLEEALAKGRHELIKKELWRWMSMQKPFRSEEGMPGGWTAEPSKKAFKGNEDYFLVRDLMRTHQGQCVAFTALYTSLARRFGLKVHPAKVIIDADGKRLAYTVEGRKNQELQGRGHVCPIDETDKHYDPTYFYLGVQHKEVKPLTDEELVADMLSHIGLDHQWQDNHEEAIRCYKEALNVLGYSKIEQATSPESLRVLVRLGGAYQFSHKPDEAIKCFKKALEISPEDASILMDLMSAYTDKGDLKEAEKYFEKAAEINPRLKEL
jgi:tetratricopeptide (TPR) repeat protein